MNIECYSDYNFPHPSSSTLVLCTDKEEITTNAAYSLCNKTISHRNIITSKIQDAALFFLSSRFKFNGTGGTFWCPKCTYEYLGYSNTIISETQFYIYSRLSVYVSNNCS